ncbi:unnamed protein product [Leptidea sinapis]|uniref:Uncharacterized protein n=1 Tax=Leptidea sinapis TaxID=189913 RepID=A0A5E4QLW2_9NEOP|nr:unnamed protein product [Leptidea sinapis]
MDITEYKSETSIITKAEKNYEKIDGDMKSQDMFRSEEKEFVKESSRSEGNKVDVLIEKMVETSRRLSDDAPVVEEVGESGKEVIIPVSVDFEVEKVATEMAQDKPITATDNSVKLPDLTKIGQNASSGNHTLIEVLLKNFDTVIDPRASIDSRLSQMEEQIRNLSALPDLIQRKVEQMKSQFDELTKEKTLQMAKAKEIATMQDETAPREFEVPVHIIQTPEPIIQIQEPTNDVKIEELKEYKSESFGQTLDEEQEYIMREKLSQELRIVKERLSPSPDRMRASPDPVRTVPYQMQPNPEQIRANPVQMLPRSELQLRPAANQKQPVVTGVKWKKADFDDASLEQMLSETLAAQSEVIQGKAMGVNFKKYEKPAPPLDHLQSSEVYKAVHNMNQAPNKKVELLKPAIAASDYIQSLRSLSPAPGKQFTEDCEV